MDLNAWTDCAALACVLCFSFSDLGLCSAFALKLEVGCHSLVLLFVVAHCMAALACFEGWVCRPLFSAMGSSARAVFNSLQTVAVFVCKGLLDRNHWKGVHR